MPHYKIVSRHACSPCTDLYTCILEDTSADTATERSIALASFTLDGRGQGEVVSCTEINWEAHLAAKRLADWTGDAAYARAMRESGEPNGDEAV
jgi:hypothetical protein